MTHSKPARKADTPLSAKASPRPAKKTVRAGKAKSRKTSAIAPERVKGILARLDQHYPKVRCALHHRNAWELLVATILSAQCTDVRVNLVTPELFRRFPTPTTMAAASLPELESLIRTTGFFRNKAKNIQGAAKRVMDTFNGKVPATMEELLSLPGVARKTANVVLGSWFQIASGVVVDTHVYRISRRLELTQSTSPEKVEQDLMQILPQSHWIDYSHQIIHLGREICVARKPRCAACFLEDICNADDKTWSTH